MKGGSKTPGRPGLAQDGFAPVGPKIITEGYKPNPQGGYVAPTQSAPANPPSGGTSGKPAANPGGSKK